MNTNNLGRWTILLSVYAKLCCTLGPTRLYPSRFNRTNLSPDQWKGDHNVPGIVYDLSLIFAS